MCNVIFCPSQVHFKRTVERLKRNHRYIPAGCGPRFQSMIDKLMLRSNIIAVEEFYSTIDMIEAEFPGTKNWLKWHLDNGRGPLIFRPLANHSICGFGNDTNGQEGLGGWLQRSYGEGKRPTWTNAIIHSVIYCKSIHDDYNDNIEGRVTRYGIASSPEARSIARKKRKIAQTGGYTPSDGRPPDTTADLIVEPDSNVKNNFIPFQFEKKLTSLVDTCVKAEYTCAMDTVLMSLFLIQKSYNYMLYHFIKDHKLNSIQKI